MNHNTETYTPNTQSPSQINHCDYIQAFLTNPPKSQMHSTHASRINQSTTLHNHRTEQRAIEPPKKNIKTTLLITDSIMRHIDEGDLGIGHNIMKVNKTYLAQLSSTRFHKEVIEINPDFIYIHLGINDLQNYNHPNHIINHLRTFIIATSKLQNTKIITSLPLPTGYYSQRHDIDLLRTNITQLLQEIKDNRPSDKDRLYYNWNTNFYDINNREHQDMDKFKTHTGDPIHVSGKGKRTILANFRYVIHDLTRKSQSIIP